MTSAIDQIIKWAQGLPAWQADAVRRLLEQGELTPEDRNEIFQMLKASWNLGPSSPEPVFPKIGGFSGTGSGVEPIVLERILDIQHVNAVQNGSTIPFGLNGLTVIYGQNGSGKSSYARILKRACRARDTKEPIHPNVFDAKEEGPATATIRITEGNVSGIPLPWTDGQSADERLTTVSFFDSRCARVIVDDNNEAVYIPYGCQVFDGLVDLLKGFRDRLQTERPSPMEPANPSVIPGTPAHAFLLQLSRNTKSEAIVAATQWTAQDEENLAGVFGRIAQSKTKEALDTARRLKSLAGRTHELLAKLTEAQNYLSISAVDKMNGEVDAVVAAEKAAQIAAQAGLQNEPLAAGVSNEWKLLYEAARNYSAKIAYPHEHFPATGPSDRCVLCQQILGDEGAERLRRFEQYMGDKSEQALRQARQQVAASVAALRARSLPEIAEYQNVFEELSADARQITEKALSLLASERSRYVEELGKGDKILSVAKAPDAQTPLKQLEEKLTAAALQAEKDADPATLKQLEITRGQLSSRKALSEIRTQIQKYVAEKELQFKYDQCAGALSTRQISDVSKNIISAALSPQLKADLAGELKKLGATHLPLNVNITGRDGGARHQLSLRETVRKAKLSEILSEGEHCVVGVAGFLAELGGTALKSPIVFDDPVSSLDHRYSRYIAQRIVEEAKSRQVIVFTHNISFLVEIEKLCAGVPLVVQTVQRTGAVPGHCIEGLPWEAMPVGKRLNYVDERINEIGKIHGVDDAEYNYKAARVYALLRETWEAFIERDLLNETVLRHDTDVQTKRLMQVEVTDEDCSRIDTGMSKCSTWMAGHDKSQKLDVNRPAPAELRSDVKELREFSKQIYKRRDTVRERRKAVLEPQASKLG